VFTPKHGSWLNLVEDFFSKLARSALRHMRVASKQELKDRLTTAIDDINRDPVVYNWTFKLDEAAWYESILGSGLRIGTLRHALMSSPANPFVARYEDYVKQDRTVQKGMDAFNALSE
jgi:hypothetical protein